MTTKRQLKAGSSPIDKLSSSEEFLLAPSHRKQNSSADQKMDPQLKNEAALVQSIPPPNPTLLEYRQPQPPPDPRVPTTRPQSKSRFLSSPFYYYFHINCLIASQMNCWLIWVHVIETEKEFNWKKKRG